MKKKVNTATKLAGKGIRYDPSFVAPDDDFEDLTNPDVRLNNLKNVHASPSRITRSRGKLVGDPSMAKQKNQLKKAHTDVSDDSDLVVIRKKKNKKMSDSENDEDDGKSSKGKEKISVNDEGDALIPPKKMKKRNRSNDGEDDAQSSKKKSKKVWDLVLGPSDHYKCQLSVHTNCGVVTALKSKLDKKQLDLFNNSCFGYFLSLPNVFPQNQLIHGMLLRELVCERDDDYGLNVDFMSVVLMPMAILLTEWAMMCQLVCKVVLHNITPTVLEKTILQLPDFKPMDAVVHFVDLPNTSKQECSQLSSDNELTLSRNDIKMLTEKVFLMEKFMKSSFELIFRALDIKNEPKVGTSIGDNDGDNSNEKNNEKPNVGSTGDDQVNDLPNVGQQNDVVPKIYHISDNLMNDVGKATDCVGSDVIRHLVDVVREKVNFVGDCIGGHVDVDSMAETFKDGDWKNFPNFDFLKFTQSSGENKDIREGKNSQVDSDWSNFTDSEVSKFTQPFRDQKTQKEGDVAVLSQNELDWSEISDAEIFKFTQPDKSVATTDATDLVCDNVRKVDATACDNVKGIEKNMVAASAMLDETPAIPR
ncbi:hypothetical protein FXO38_01926 [Capsicum annuum]|nr:hypothetical protein FXO38_01926 [Capsicum annuum]